MGDVQGLYGVSMSGPAVWALCCNDNISQRMQAVTPDGFTAYDPTAPPQESMEGVKAVDTKTGGMYLDAASYETSFYTEGIKYKDPSDGYVYSITSTNTSNVRSKEYNGQSYKTFEVWYSSDRRAMDASPFMNVCEIRAYHFIFWF